MTAFTSSQTGNWSSSSTWGGAGVPGNGDTATVNHNVTVDVNTTVGTSPSDQTTVVLTIAAGITLTIAAGVTFTLRGNANSGGNTGGGPTFQAGSVLEFDASVAGTTSTTYKWDLMRQFTGPASFVCSGSSGSRVTIRSNAGGGNGYFAAGNGPVSATVSYTDFLRIGDTTNNALTWIPASVDHAIFNTCGLVDMPTSTSAYSYTNCTWKNTNAKTNGGTGLVNPAAIRPDNASAATGKIMSGCIFDKPPIVAGNLSRYDDCVFFDGFDTSGPNAGGNWDRMLRCVIRLTANGGLPVYGSTTNCIIVADNAPSALVTGTATSGSLTTLTDSGKSWTTNQYQDDRAAGHGYFVQLTGGTGSGQVRRIAANTATQLTVGPAFDTAPDATTAYSIHLGLSNAHFLSITGGGTFDGNVFEMMGTNEDGDCLLHFTGSTALTATHNIVLANAGKGNSGTLITLGSATNVTAEHNTAHTGNQSMLAYSDGFTATAGGILSCKSNIAWYGFTAPSSGGLGAYVVCDAVNATTPNSGVLDVVTGANADYNAKYNLTTNAQTGDAGYAIHRTAAPGAHDVTANPSFVDAYRNCASWAVSLGATGTTLQKQAKAFAYLRAVNEPSDPNYLSTATPTNLLTYLNAGFAPTNAAFHNTAHDGTDIGAVAFQSSSLPPLPYLKLQAVRAASTY